MDNDELLEHCLPIYYAKGLENIEEANEVAEELIREHTYLTDRPSQDRQILQIWLLGRAALHRQQPQSSQPTAASRQIQPSSSAAGQSIGAFLSHRTVKLTECTAPDPAAAFSSPEARSSSVAGPSSRTEADVTASAPASGSSSAAPMGAGTTSNLMRTLAAEQEIKSTDRVYSLPSRIQIKRAYELDVAAEATSSPRTDPIPTIIACPPPVVTSPASGETSASAVAAPLPATSRSTLDPRRPWFVPRSQLGLPYQPPHPSAPAQVPPIPAPMQRFHYAFRNDHENKVLSSLDRRMLTLKRQIEELKAQISQLLTECDEAIAFVDTHKLVETQGEGRKKMLHAQWANKRAETLKKEMNRKMEEYHKLKEEQNDKYMDKFPGEGEMGPRE
ncbi:MAG: hypothetical protein Q9218_007659 [Villophora microphyllina]